MADERKGNGFFRLLISATSQESSKRFVVVGSIVIFLAVQIIMAVIMVLIIIRLLAVPQYVTDQFFTLFKQLAEYDRDIIMFGIGAIALTNGISSVSQWFGGAKKIMAEKGVPDTVVKNENVQQQTVTPGAVQNSD